MGSVLDTIKQLFSSIFGNTDQTRKSITSKIDEINGSIQSRINGLTGMCDDKQGEFTSKCEDLEKKFESKLSSIFGPLSQPDNENEHKNSSNKGGVSEPTPSAAQISGSKNFTAKPAANVVTNVTAKVTSNATVKTENKAAATPRKSNDNSTQNLNGFYGNNEPELTFTGNRWCISMSLNAYNHFFASYTVKGDSDLAGEYYKLDRGASKIIKEMAKSLGIEASASAGAAKLAELILRKKLGAKFTEPTRGASQTICYHAIINGYLLDYVYENDGCGNPDSIKKNAHIYVKKS